MSRYTFRPLDRWSDPETRDRRSAAAFRVKWDTTLRQLCYEADQLGADLVVVQVVASEHDLRQDGMLRARAVIGHPGAVVSMDTGHGPLRFACDTYEQRYYSDQRSWQANVRAIVLALEALRAVDRYGVTRRGEQYQGWQQIAARPHGGGMSRAEAAEFIAAHANTVSGGRLTAAELLTHRGLVLPAFRTAARVLHPDAGGDLDQFARLTAAKDVLERGEG